MKGFIVLVISAGFLSACATPPAAPMAAGARLDRARAVATNWNTYSDLVAMKIIDEYGPPDKIEPDRLTWYDKEPWNEIAVREVENPYTSDVLGPDNLEQTISYSVPRDKLKALAAFSDKLSVSAAGTELAVSGNSEALNILTLNLANEIVRGDKGPDDARRFYDRVYELSRAGKSSPYTQGLLFSVPRLELPRSSEERSDILTTPLDIWAH